MTVESLGAVAKRWVEQSCAAQDLPTHIDDEATLRSVAVLLSAGRELPLESARDRVSRIVETSFKPDGGDKLRQVRVWAVVGPVEFLVGESKTGEYFGARCDECGGRFVSGWERDGGAVSVAAVRHGKQVHGSGPTGATRA